MSAPLSEQQLAEIRAAAVRAVEAHPSTTFMAPCESLAAAVLDAALPPLLAEVDRLRRALSEATDHVAEPDTDASDAFMQLGATPSLAGLRAELHIEGHPPIVGRYAGFGSRSVGDGEALLIEPALLFHWPAEDQPEGGAE